MIKARIIWWAHLITDSNSTENKSKILVKNPVKSVSFEFKKELVLSEDDSKLFSKITVAPERVKGYKKNKKTNRKKVDITRQIMHEDFFLFLFEWVLIMYIVFLSKKYKKAFVTKNNFRLEIFKFYLTGFQFYNKKLSEYKTYLIFTWLKFFLKINYGTSGVLAYNKNVSMELNSDGVLEPVLTPSKSNIVAPVEFIFSELRLHRSRFLYKHVSDNANITTYMHLSCPTPNIFQTYSKIATYGLPIIE